MKESLLILLAIFLVPCITEAQTVKQKTVFYKHQGRNWIDEIEEFDKAGRLIRWTTCDDRRCKTKTVFEYDYDERGLMIAYRMFSNENDSIRIHYDTKTCVHPEYVGFLPTNLEECIAGYAYPHFMQQNKNCQLIAHWKRERLTSANEFQFPLHWVHGNLENEIFRYAHRKGSTDHFCNVTPAYDTDGKLVKEVYKYFREGSHVATSTNFYTYDNRDRLTRKLVVDVGLSGPGLTVEYAWEEDRLVKQVIVQQDRSEITHFFYDEAGWLVKSVEELTVSDSKKSRKWVTRVKYEFHNE